MFLAWFICVTHMTQCIQSLVAVPTTQQPPSTNGGVNKKYCMHAVDLCTLHSYFGNMRRQWLYNCSLNVAPFAAGVCHPIYALLSAHPEAPVQIALITGICLVCCLSHGSSCVQPRVCGVHGIQFFCCCAP